MTRNEDFSGNPEEMSSAEVARRFAEIADANPELHDPLPGPRDYHLAEEEDEGFTPPPAPPIRFTHWAYPLGWGLLSVGVVALVILGLFPFPGSAFWATLALLAAAGGIGVLLTRLQKHRRDYD